jgi:uncharacterized protein
MKIDPTTEGIRVVIIGHSHIPMIDERNGVILLNPGSVGPRRFKLPVSMARMKVQDEAVEIRFIRLMG